MQRSRNSLLIACRVSSEIDADASVAAELQSDIKTVCQSYFCFELPSVVHDRRAKKFDIKYRNHSNIFCQIISHL